MSLLSNKLLLRLALFFLVFNVAVFTAPAQSQQNTSKSQSRSASAQTADVSDIAKNPEQYTGKKVSVQWKVDKVYGPNAIGLEKDEKHLLVVGVTPGALGDTSTMKRGDPFTATGVVRNFDRAAFEHEYGNVDFGKSALHEFDNKPVLVVGARQAAELRQPQTSTIEREKPSSNTQPSPTTEPSQAQVGENRTLPKTASPLPLIALVGVLALMAALTLPLLRHD
jgi:hypothetical protein